MPCARLQLTWRLGQLPVQKGLNKQLSSMWMAAYCTTAAQEA